MVGRDGMTTHLEPAVLFRSLKSYATLSAFDKFRLDHNAKTSVSGYAHFSVRELHLLVRARILRHNGEDFVRIHCGSSRCHCQFFGSRNIEIILIRELVSKVKKNVVIKRQGTNNYHRLWRREVPLKILTSLQRGAKE